MLKRSYMVVLVIVALCAFSLISTSQVRSTETEEEEYGVIELWACQDDDENQMCLSSDDSYIDGVLGCLVYPDGSESCRTTEDGFYFWDVPIDAVYTLYVNDSQSPPGMYLDSVLCHTYPGEEYNLCTYQRTVEGLQAEITFDGVENGIQVSFVFKPIANATPTPIITPTPSATLNSTASPTSTASVTNTPTATSTQMPTATLPASTVAPSPTSTLEHRLFRYFLPTTFR